MNYIVINVNYANHSVSFREESIWFNSEHKGELKNPKNYLDILGLAGYTPENSELPIIVKKQLEQDHKEHVAEVMKEYLPKQSEVEIKETETSVPENKSDVSIQKPEENKVDDQNVEEEKPSEEALELMTIKQLQKYAEEHEINLEGLSKKHDIIEAIIKK